MACRTTLNYGADHGQHGYSLIRRNLRESNPARLTLQAVKASAWGTGGLGVLVLATVAVLANRYRHHRLSQ